MAKELGIDISSLKVEKIGGLRRISFIKFIRRFIIGRSWRSVFITFRILDTADMTAEGPSHLGQQLWLPRIQAGRNPRLAAALFGLSVRMIAGLVWDSPCTKMKKIPALLTGTVTLTGLYLSILKSGGTQPLYWRCQYHFQKCHEVGLSNEEAVFWLVFLSDHRLYLIDPINEDATAWFCARLVITFQWVRPMGSM